LASPPLVVAYALAGTMTKNLVEEPIGFDKNNEAVYLKDIWPSQAEINSKVASAISAELYRSKYANVFDGTAQWQQLDTPEGETYAWPESTYVRNPPYFDDMQHKPESLQPINDARCIVKVGDSITTDHISPAGAIQATSPAGEYLQSQGIEVKDFNSLGSRRGNHEVMMRGTFANTRLRNQLAPDTEGGYTTYWPDQKVTSIYDAAMKYKASKTPLIVLAGKEYGTGSSRDWAAKGTKLLGIEAVIAQSYERIHRSNLVGFGVLPLEYSDNESADSLGLTGQERFSFSSLESKPTSLMVTAIKENGEKIEFTVKVRIDTQSEWHYYQHGGILHYVLRNLAS